MEVNSKYHIKEEQMFKEMEIIERSKKDPQHFGPLYDRYYEPIFRYIYQRMDDQDLAFDTTQQVFMKALQNIGKFEFRGVPFVSWLYRIAHSEVHQLFRNNKAERTVNIESYGIQDMLKELEEEDMEVYHRKIAEAIAQLPQEDLQLIEMRFFEKRPFKEIGEILELTENYAKIKLYRVLDKVKKLIK